MPIIYNRTAGNTSLILGPFESLNYPFNFGSYNEIRVVFGLSAMQSTGNYLTAIASDENVTPNSSSNSFFYFGVKPYSNLMPYQETGLGFIGSAMGSNSESFLLNSSNGEVRTAGSFKNVFACVISGTAVQSPSTTQRGIGIVVSQSQLNNGFSALCGFDFAVSNIGATTQNYNYQAFRGSDFNGGSLYANKYNFNSVISSGFSKLAGVYATMTGFLTSNTAGNTGAPLSLPNSVFIYNPFSTVSLLVENLAVIKIS